MGDFGCIIMQSKHAFIMLKYLFWTDFFASNKQFLLFNVFKESSVHILLFYVNRYTNFDMVLNHCIDESLGRDRSMTKFSKRHNYRVSKP